MLKISTCTVYTDSISLCSCVRSQSAQVTPPTLSAVALLHSGLKQTLPHSIATLGEKHRDLFILIPAVDCRVVVILRTGSMYVLESWISLENGISWFFSEWLLSLQMPLVY